MASIFIFNFYFQFLFSRINKILFSRLLWKIQQVILKFDLVFFECTDNLHGLGNQKSQIYEDLAALIIKRTDSNLKVKTINQNGSIFCHNWASQLERSF